MLATALTIITATYLFASMFVLASRKVGYRHIADTLSEIGEIGSRDQRFVAFGLFLPIGVLLLLVAYLVFPVSRASAALALCVAVGYVGAAVFPCDPGSPMSGTPRQAAHNLAGAVEYAGGGFALMTLAESLGPAFKIAGFVVLGSAIALSVVPANSVRGLIQRAAEMCLFGGLALSIWRVGAAA
ncbi:MAG: DUF998 domain-containing protein [Dokdonella sp.]